MKKTWPVPGFNETYLGCMAMGDWIDERVKVECRQVGVLCFDVNNGWGVVPRQVHMVRQRVVQVRERDAILGSDGLTNNDFVDVIELIPIFIPYQLLVLHQGFKFGAPRDGQV